MTLVVAPQLFAYPNSPCFVRVKLQMYASCTIRRPCLWPKYSANAFHIRAVGVMWGYRVWVWHLAPGDDVNGDHHRRHRRQRLRRQRCVAHTIGPDRNCRYLNWAWWRSIDCQTWRCRRVASPQYNCVRVPIPNRDYVADSRDQFHVMICRREWWKWK